MKKKHGLGLLVPFALATLWASEALGQANRVFVSARSGSDANACSGIATPCQTFAGAVSQVNAGGEVIVLDSGGYGPVTIGKALTIEAPPGVLAFVHPPSGDGVTINAGASDTVVLRGLILNGGAGNGVTVNTVGSLHVESCVISGFVNGMSFLAAGQLFVKDTIARNNANIGIGVSAASGSPKASLDHCRLEDNVDGLSVSRGSVTIRDSVASGNSRYGFYAVSLGGSPVELTVEDCLAANNASAGIVSQAATATVRVSDTTVTDNATGIAQLSSGVMLTRMTNTVEGNTPNGGFTGTYTAK
jgi:parallel beta helix pectate lyase-like protein